MLLRAALLSCLLLVAAGPAAALSIRLAVDPLQSSLTPAGGGPDPLEGRLQFELGGLPLGGSPTPLDVSELRLTSASGLVVHLDDALANPGAGVLRPDGSFEIPTLFVTVDDAGLVFDLGITDVTGTVSFGPSGGAIFELATSFTLDAGPDGLIDVVLVAVPEPASAGLVALGLLALGARRGAWRRRR